MSETESADGTPLPDALVISRTVRIPLADFEFTHSRSSGPGGQNVNKVNSRVTLRWAATTTTALKPELLARFLAEYAPRLTQAGELLISSDEYRDQHKNRDECLSRLKQLIVAVLIPPKPRRPTKPSAGAKRRRLADKKHRQQTRAGRRPPTAE